ncbi:MAG: HisA/HisF-related TIM barrel protein [Bacteroidota bacterium]
MTASGGLTTLEDLEGLQKIGLEGAILGKAWYEGLLREKELQAFL